MLNSQLDSQSVREKAVCSASCLASLVWELLFQSGEKIEHLQELEQELGWHCDCLMA